MTKTKQRKTGYYIAYGSNMNLEQMGYRCPNSKLIGTGYIEGWELVFNCHADIIRTENEKQKLPVVIWEIVPKDWQTLDFYEGYPGYYVTEDIPFIFDGQEKIGTVYVMAEKRKGLYPPSKDYFYGLIDGCKENNIDDEYMYDALKKSCYNVTEFNQYNPRG